MSNKQSDDRHKPQPIRDATERPTQPERTRREVMDDFDEDTLREVWMALVEETKKSTSTGKRQK